MAKITVTLKKSTIGFPQNQRRVVESLGLRKLHHTVVHEDTDSIKGMIFKVKHLVEVKPVETIE